MALDGYVVVAGGINMDIQARSRAAFRPGDSNPGEALLSPGGVGRNIAENLGRLGVGVELVTVLGDDALSESLVASCAALRIHLRGAIRARGSPSSLYVCLLDGGEEGRGSLIGAVAAMDSLALLGPERLAERSGLLDGAALVVVDANLPAESLAWLAARYGRGGELQAERKRRPLLLLDPVSTAKAERARPLVGAFDAIKPNLAELEVLAGREARDEAGIRAACAALRAAGAGELLLSLGSRGLLYEGPDPSVPGGVERGLVPPPPLEVRNVSGAGDAALAAFAWGLLLGKPLEWRARRAAAAAGLAAASDATVNPALTPARLEAIVQGDPT